ncbi:MAG TPA: response regulator transcription factor [Pyrinomonadaceae bacterium]|jgi:DNA-binding response OmpR family regulator
MEATVSSGTVLIVEDDEKTAALVSLYLEREGFKTIMAADGKQALEMAQRHRPIFAILDLMLPNLDGWEVCRELRHASEIPILILTAREEEIDRILGLTLGADDYMVKPFSPGELVARVKAILRRVRTEPARAAQALSHRGLCLNPEKRRVTVNGKPVALTPSEFKLLHVLMTAPGRVFLREELVNKLYPSGEAVIDRVIDVHLGNLRQKIEKDASHPLYILTVRGVGYRFADGEE